MLPVNQIICGDCREVLKEFDSNSVDCVITSPPYWLMRDYGLPPLVWGGDANCEHEWGDEVFARQRSVLKETTTEKEKQQEEGAKVSMGLGRFCKKCNAWLGSLGMEPFVELFVEHLVSIFDEIKRVLKPEGTCWVNLGDTYASAPAGNKKVKFIGDGVYGRVMLRNAMGGNAPLTAKPTKYSVPIKSLCLVPYRFAIAMTERGWILRNIIIWHKPNCVPQSVKDRFTVDYEPIFFFTKSQKYYFKQITEHSKTWGTRNKRSIWSIPAKSAPVKVIHFATFPEELVIPMIEAGCPPNGIVLDPFCGIGTTCIAAKKLGRAYIGIDMHPKYCEVARQLLNEITPTLFNNSKQSSH